ncbi:exonuclease V-like [Patiria miniata]|uniref:Exonuclease V n=1 Tax=Patiria miniata TaxID=46514 RepID=A0A914A0E9_PATMI|nr:exonuclease V-like [Patiria miniata]
MDDAHDEFAFGSQDDALLHRALDAFDTFEATEAAVSMDVEDKEDSQESITESQNRALHEAYEAFEQTSVAGGATVNNSNPVFKGLSNEASSTSGLTISSPKTDKSERSSSLPYELNARSKESLRLGNTYLTVSNLVAQLWCEQQMVYNFWKPDLEFIVETTPAMPAKHKAAVKAVVAAASGGNKIHEKRDREVNKYVPVKAKTREDRYSIRLINIIVSLRGLLLCGEPCAREIPIFGMPLGHQFLVVGTIDELRFDSHGRFELVEFKTRGDLSRPIRRQQMQAYKMQMMLYKQMLDDLVRGRVDGREVLRSLRMDPDQVLIDELLPYVRALGDGLRTSITLGELMTIVLQQFEFLSHVEVLTLEFSGRDNSATVAKETVEFDADWLRQRLDHCRAYWTEEREVEGVDIEDTWKCRICAFYDTCQWRQKMNEICAQKNTVGKIK